MWNNLSLECPSNDMTEYQSHEIAAIEELRDIVTVLTTAADILTSENPLWEETRILRQMQMKYKKILRCDKALVYIQRVSHCLKKMVLINLSKSYLDLAERFLNGFASQGSFFATVKLPSEQQIEYILIRTISASKLVCECIKYSRETFCYLLQKMKCGHTLLDLMSTTSVIARLIVLLKGILEQIYDIYTKVLACRLKLKKGAYQWPEELDLPNDLKQWMETSNSEIFKPIHMSQDDMQMLSSVLKKKDQNKDSDAESIIIVNEVINVNDISEQVQNGNATDYGEIIPRKKSKKACSLTAEQKLLLQKIMHVQNLEELEDMWHLLNSSSSGYLPKKLSNKKVEIISKLFVQIRSHLSKKNSNKKSKQPVFLKNALGIFSKHLGFTQNQIEECNKFLVSNMRHSVEDMKLEPVKTLKELKILYKKLCKILEFSNEFEKYRKLQKVFKRRRTDIRLLRQSGEKSTAKKLIFCTSKVLLTLCQK